MQFQYLAGYLAIAAVIIIALVVVWTLIQLLIHPPSTKTETGETTRELRRQSLHAPGGQEPYPTQSKADGEIILAQWYKYFGTEAEKARALALLKRRGYGAA